MRNIVVSVIIMCLIWKERVRKGTSGWYGFDLSVFRARQQLSQTVDSGTGFVNMYCV